MTNITGLPDLQRFDRALKPTCCSGLIDWTQRVRHDSRGLRQNCWHNTFLFVISAGKAGSRLLLTSCNFCRWVPSIGEKGVVWLPNGRIPWN